MILHEKKITVRNPNGVHSRIAANLARIAQENGVILYLIHDGQRIDCSSILDVLSIALVKGSSFVVRADGKQPEKALNEVEILLTRKDT